MFVFSGSDFTIAHPKSTLYKFDTDALWTPAISSCLWKWSFYKVDIKLGTIDYDF